MSFLVNTRERTRFLRFLVVGLIGFVIDFGVMNLCTRVFKMSLVAGGTISFIAAIISNFTWNRYWTYPDSRSKPVVHQLTTFAVVSVTGLDIRAPLLHFIEPVMLRFVTGHLSWISSWIDFFSPDFLGKNATLAIAVVVVLFWNFFANRYITYNDVK